MKRRDFISLMSGTALAWPLAARAQQTASPVVGFLNTQSAADSTQYIAGFRRGLSQTDFVEGSNVTVDYRWAEGQYDRMPGAAADLVKRGVAAILAAYFPAVLAAKAATSTTPIVFISGLDPVESGLVSSLNRPGGNLTGLSIYNASLVAKRLEQMHQLVPQANAIALLINPATPASHAMEIEATSAAKTFGLRLVLLRASAASDIDAAFATLPEERAGALIVAGDSFFESRFQKILALAAQYKIPASYSRREDTIAGGLMSYGANLAELYRQAGVYVGKILKGAKPADLPVEQATKVELVVNLKTARALGVEMPTAILVRADEVIE